MKRAHTAVVHSRMVSSQAILNIIILGFMRTLVSWLDEDDIYRAICRLVW